MTALCGNCVAFRLSEGCMCVRVCVCDDVCAGYICAYMFNCLCDLQFELWLRVENAIVLIKMTAMERVKLLHSANANVSSADAVCGVSTACWRHHYQQQQQQKWQMLRLVHCIAAAIWRRVCAANFVSFDEIFMQMSVTLFIGKSFVTAVVNFSPNDIEFLISTV